jgi:ketosteroid isomerase-like protein
LSVQPVTPAYAEPVKEDFQRLEDRWAAAVAARDLTAAADLLADDFVLSSSGGVAPTASRTDWLHTLPQIETTSLSAVVREVRVFDAVAVVQAQLEWQARLGARDLSGSYAVTDIFNRHGGEWKVSWRLSIRIPTG